MEAQNILLYDGDCGFCSFWVQWILERDKVGKIKFASLQSEFAQNFLKERNLKVDNFDTVYLITDNAYYVKMDAISHVGKILGGWYSSFMLLSYLPKFITNPIYDAIARNRKSLMTEACLLPTVEQRKRFIS